MPRSSAICWLSRLARERAGLGALALSGRPRACEAAQARDDRRRPAPRRQRPGRAGPRRAHAAAHPRRPWRRAKADVVAPRAWPSSSRPPRGCGLGGRAPSHSCRGDSPSRRGARGATPRDARSGRAPATGRMHAPRSADSRTRSHSPNPRAPGFSRIAFDTPTRPRSCASAARRRRVTDSAGRPSRQAAASASSATFVECSRSHGDLRPVSAAIAVNAASTRSPSIQSSGNGSASSACSQIRVSSSPASVPKLRRASLASRGSYAAPVRCSTTDRASLGPDAVRKKETSLATCRRRIDNGISSPRAFGNPRPSQRAKTYSSAPSMPGRGRATPRTAARPHTSPRTNHEPVGRRWRSRPPGSPDAPRAVCPPRRTRVEPKHLRRIRRVDEEEGSAVRDVVAVELCSFVPVGGTARGVKQRDVVRVGELFADAPASSPRRTARPAVRSACSSGWPVPRSVASDSALTTSAHGLPLARRRHCCNRYAVVRRHPVTLLCARFRSNLQVSVAWRQSCLEAQKAGRGGGNAR